MMRVIQFVSLLLTLLFLSSQASGTKSQSLYDGQSDFQESLSHNSDKEKCLGEMDKIFTESSLEKGKKTLLTYISEFCYKQNLRLPKLTIDAVKPANCFYSGFFLIRYLREVRANTGKLDGFKNDFCNKFHDAMPQRSEFVKIILGLGEAEFDSGCKEQFQSITGLNEWFSPIDPMVSISQNEICDLHKKLFKSLKLKGITSLAEHVAFSYLITLDLFLNANQQEDYESCINYDVTESPKKLCLKYLEEQPLFQIWDLQEQTDICSTVTQKVKQACDGDQGCDSCSIMLAIIFQNYQKYLNDMYAQIFKEYEDDMFNSLEAENKKVHFGDSSSKKSLSQTNMPNLRL